MKIRSSTLCICALFCAVLSGSSLAASKAKVICIGLNHIDPKHYAGDKGELSGCDNDAKDMLAIGAKYLKDTGGVLLLDEQATRTAVSDAIKSAEKGLVAGDILMISYSGHGGQIPDADADAQNKMDQTWCLYDGQMLDKELYALFACLPEGVRVLVFSDSCHSEGITKQMALEYKAAIAQAGKDVEPPVSVRVRSQRFDIGAANNPKFKVKRLSPSTIIRTYLNNEKTYDEILQTVDAHAPTPPINPWVLSISACKDDETAGDAGSGSNSVFTAALKAVWADGKYRADGGYQTFQEEIGAAARISRPEQHATSRMIDSDSMKYWWQYPFTLAAP